MKTIGVTSRPRRGYVAGHRGYVALFRGHVARRTRKPLFFLGFPDHFRPLPFFYLLSTSGPCEQPAASSTPAPCDRRCPAPSACRPTGSPGLRAGVFHRLGGCAAFVHGAASSTAICQRTKSFPATNHPQPDSTAQCSLAACWFWEGPHSHWGKARQGRVRPEGQGRGEPVGGCGTPAAWPGLSTPLWCGQRSRPWAGAGGLTRGALTAFFAHRWARNAVRDIAVIDSQVTQSPPIAEQRVTPFVAGNAVAESHVTQQCRAHYVAGQHVTQFRRPELALRVICDPFLRFPDAKPWVIGVTCDAIQQTASVTRRCMQRRVTYGHLD
ncbi:hypothetical protein BTP_996 [Burkholderia thailandensis Phuket 4W-1]|nr:hypothetical protein BTP_996 [Burkholderia thailandensis Phuket 4W-1]